MSPVRLTVTAAVMATIALLLAAVTPPRALLVVACTAPQRLADTSGPDAVVLCAAALMAWLCWAWGALGLLLTAAGALPGWLGWVARRVARSLLPEAARRAAAVALGMACGVAGPLSGVALAAGGVVRDVPAASRTATSEPAPVPDWPAAASPGTHLVVRGDCLWRIAGGALRASGSSPSDAEIAAAVHAWWSANATVVGPDPDLLLPGQVLQPPPETR